MITRYFCFLLLVVVALSPSVNCRRVKLLGADPSLGKITSDMKAFTKILIEQPKGWNVCVRDKDSNYYHFWMKFVNEERVLMQSAANMLPIGTINLLRDGHIKKESSYTVKGLQQPTLSFTTYNYLSLLSDPDIPNANGRQGSGRGVGSEFAFTIQVVDALAKQGKNIDTFTLVDRINRGTVMRFSRVPANAKEPIAIKVLKAQRKLDSIRWKDSNSVNVITGINTSPNDEYLYDLHNAWDDGAVYTSVIAFTNPKTRKGAAFSYYFDCAGRFRFKKFIAEGAGVRKSFVDPKLQRDLLQYYLDDFAWVASNDSLNLKCAKVSLNTAKKQEVKLTSKSICCIQSTGDKYQVDSMLFSTALIYFKGFTFRNIRDYSRSGSRNNHSIGFRWFVIKLNKNGTPDTTLSVLRQIGPGNSSEAYVIFNNKMKKRSRTNGSGCQLAQFSFDTLQIGFFSYGNGPSISPNPTWGKYRSYFLGRGHEAVVKHVLQNDYVMLPTILGFQLHRESKTPSSGSSMTNCTSGNSGGSSSSQPPTGVLIPLYFLEDVE